MSNGPRGYRAEWSAADAMNEYHADFLAHDLLAEARARGARFRLGRDWRAPSTNHRLHRALRRLQEWIRIVRHPHRQAAGVEGAARSPTAPRLTRG